MTGGEVDLSTWAGEASAAAAAQGQAAHPVPDWLLPTWLRGPSAEQVVADTRRWIEIGGSPAAAPEFPAVQPAPDTLLTEAQGWIKDAWLRFQPTWDQYRARPGRRVQPLPPVPNLDDLERLPAALQEAARAAGYRDALGYGTEVLSRVAGFGTNPAPGVDPFRLPRACPHAEVAGGDAERPGEAASVLTAAWLQVALGTDRRCLACGMRFCPECAPAGGGAPCPKCHGPVWGDQETLPAGSANPDLGDY